MQLIADGTGDEGDTPDPPESSNDELAGLADVEVLAARMCVLARLVVLALRIEVAKDM